MLFALMFLFYVEKKEEDNDKECDEDETGAQNDTAADGRWRCIAERNRSKFGDSVSRGKEDEQQNEQREHEHEIYVEQRPAPAVGPG
jgi:hypothetical protein